MRPFRSSATAPTANGGSTVPFAVPKTLATHSTAFEIVHVSERADTYHGVTKPQYVYEIQHLDGATVGRRELLALSRTPARDALAETVRVAESESDTVGPLVLTHITLESGTECYVFDPAAPRLPPRRAPVAAGATPASDDGYGESLLACEPPQWEAA